jgi:exopolyphosphatase / guanosine-5'-triphosphate,3'-diphosphate pyrophosphatase
MEKTLARDPATGLASPPRRGEQAGTEPEVLAAVDLGSNSFHMVLARLIAGELHVLERMREMVQLGAGLDRRGRLRTTVQRRALACLERFGQRLRAMPPGTVRVVGTNALRRARDAEAFVGQAELALGHPIEVISGHEEARLIYLGVAHSLARSGERRLVVDIGGGSTELIIGEGFDAIHMESLRLGCVSMTAEYFASGAITRTAMTRAGLAARLELEPVEVRFRELGWRTATGASGTILAAAEVARAAGWSEGDLTRAALHKLREELLAAGHVDKLALPGLRAERAAIFPGGLAVLQAAFEALGIERLGVSDGALREGLLYDLLGRIRHEDVRDRTIRGLSARYQVDTGHAARVEHTALACLGQVAPDWGLRAEGDADVLSWAARLHEIGLAVAHSGYHRRGAYIVEHSDLAGFSREEQRLLAALIRVHRRKLPRDAFAGLPAAQAERALRLCVLLRLAVHLHHSRTDQPLPALRLSVTGRGLRLRFPRGWLAQHPLTQADLAQEVKYLSAAGVAFRFG